MAPTPFDLNRALLDWRESRARESTWRAEDLDEMVSHLQDSVVVLQGKGLTTDEAFLVATRRLGPGREVAEELARVHPGEVYRVRAIWMLVGMLLLGLVGDVARVFSEVVMLGGSRWLEGGGALGWLGLLARGSVLAAVGVVFAGFALGRWPARGGQWKVPQLRAAWVVPALLVVLIGLRIQAMLVPIALVRVLDPATLGGVYLVRGWGAAVEALVFMVVAVVFLVALMRRGAGAGRGLAAVLVAAGMTFGAAPRTEAAASAPVREASAAAPVAVEEVLRLWKASKKDEALEGFLRVDFARRPLFAKGSPLGYSEREFMALPRAVNEKMHAQILEEVRPMKGLAVHVKEAAGAAAARGDGARADLCLGQLKKFGTALEHPDSLALLQLVGKAFNKLAAR